MARTKPPVPFFNVRIPGGIKRLDAPIRMYEVCGRKLVLHRSDIAPGMVRYKYTVSDYLTGMALGSGDQRITAERRANHLVHGVNNPKLGFSWDKYPNINSDEFFRGYEAGMLLTEQAPIDYRVGMAMSLQADTMLQNLFMDNTPKK